MGTHPMKPRYYHRRVDLERLRALIPVPCMIFVAPDPAGFIVQTAVGRVLFGPKRFEVTAAFISGYVAGWTDEQENR